MDEKTKRLAQAAKALLQFGAHAGECTNTAVCDKCGSHLDGCDLHRVAMTARVEELQKALEEVSPCSTFCPPGRKECQITESGKCQADLELEVSPPLPEMFIVSCGDTCWILDDGTTGRPIMGAGPFIKYFGSTNEAQDAIDEFIGKGFDDDTAFKVRSTHEELQD